MDKKARTTKRSTRRSRERLDAKNRRGSERQQGRARCSCTLKASEHVRAAHVTRKCLTLLLLNRPDELSPRYDLVKEDRAYMHQFFDKRCVEFVLDFVLEY